MADFYLNPVTEDLDVSTGDFRFTSGIETTAQLIELRLSAFKGEWRYDLDNGVDYFGRILGKKPSDAELTAIFRLALAETEGVDSVTSLVVSKNRVTREYTITWQVKVGETFIDGSRDI